MCYAIQAPVKLARISGFARSFLLNTPIRNATITILETGQTFQTDKKGHYGPIQYPAGQPLTLELKKFGYKTTQSETVIVPQSGLETTYDNITFQVPTLLTYYIMAAIMGASIDANSCHVATTITSYHKTLDVAPQGEIDAKVVLTPSSNQPPFYFDIFKKWPLNDKTNPFTKGLKLTSEDGGVAFFNLPPSKTLYKLTAIKKGHSFTTAYFLCRKGAFINISPPRGPSVME